MPSWKKVIISGSDAALNSLNVTNSLTASGIIYPTTDGTSGQVVITDGNGNLSFSNVENTTISIKNMSGATIAKGTPCYITGSGTSGNLAGVWPADASNPLRMPAGVIAGEALTAGAEGIGLVNGFISGVNTSAFNAGDSVYVAVGGGYTNVKPTGSSVLIQKLGNVEKSHASNGSGVINGPGYYNEVPNIQQGYTWVGNNNGVATPIATSSIQNVVSSSFAVSSSRAISAASATQASTVSISGINTNAEYAFPLILTGSSGASIGLNNDTSPGFSYNASTNLFKIFNLAGTGSLFGTSSWAENARTASYINTLNQDVIISGSATIGSNTAGPNENSLTLGARDGASEGGQIGFNAPGGTYTSASFIDNWQNKHRILKGNNTTSTALIAQWDIHTTQMQLPGYTAASSFPGTATANLAVDSSGNVITVSTTGGSVFPYTGNAVITGSLTTTGIIYAQPNGGMYFQGGDDAALYDINVVNTMGIYGMQDSTVGAIKLGSSGPVLYGSGSSLGIGTTTPNAKLDVNGNAIITGSITATGAINGSSIGMTNIVTGYVPYFNGSILDDSPVYTNGTNVGIGTASPQADLHVNGTNAKLRVGPWFSVSDRDYVEILAHGTDTKIVSPNERFHIENTSGDIILTPGGNVGIGTTTPNAKLDVNGNAIITGSLTVTGRITAEEFHTEFVSSSIIYQSGSTKFGDSSDDVMSVTGSLRVNGSITGSLFGTASWATDVLNNGVTSVATNNGLTGGTITSTGTIGLTGQALALHNLSTNGIIVRTGSGTVAGRTLTGTSNQITVTNGDGVSGNPTVSLPTTITGLTSVTSTTFAGALSGNASTATTASYATVAQSVLGTITNALTASYINQLVQPVVITGSFNQGVQNTITGTNAHAQGLETMASGSYSHAEGRDTLASGIYSHAEGYFATASGTAAHAEGISTLASGEYSHTEGYGTLASNLYAHAEGYFTTASGQSSHAEGLTTIASGAYSHAEGDTTVAQGYASHAEGRLTTAVGSRSHAEGSATSASGNYSHAEGNTTTSIGLYSHAEGEATKASGSHSHAEGKQTTAQGGYSHSEGDNTLALGGASHAEGLYTTASGDHSHAEGNTTLASGNSSHAEGDSTIAYGNSSHAEGVATTAFGLGSHVEGLQTISSGSYQHVQGQYNLSSSAQSAFIIGNGTGQGASRSNLVFASGSQFQVTGSVIATQGFTGSLLGTASYATQAATASWATNVTNNGVTSVSASGTVSGLTLGGGPITSTGTVTLSGTISGLTNSNLSGTAGITNANLANPSLRIGSTNIALGATGSSLTGLSSVSATTFTGALTGNASTATTASVAEAVKTNGAGSGTWYPLMQAGASTGYLVPAFNSAFSYNGTTGILNTTASFATTASYVASAATAGSTTAAVTFNNGGAGAASGTTFNGSTARTISYNTIGAQPLLTNPVTGTGTSGRVAYWNGTNSITSDGDLTFDGSSLTVGSAVYTPTYATVTVESRSKLRLWGDDTNYAIGFISGVTYGGLNDYAMTFQVNEESDRGFWWGASSFTTAQGAMALTTDGNLTVASRIKVGYGTSDTSTPTAPLDAKGVRIGRDFSISDRATVRLDSNGTGVPADILFGHTAAANETSWTGVYWSLSSRGTEASNSFQIFRGGGNPGGSGEGVVMTITPAAGNIGIGTTSPGSYKLNVAGGQYGTYLKGGDLGTGSDILRLVDSGDNTKYLARGDGKHFFTGDTDIQGTLTATVKSFIIDHPTKQGKKLQYGVLEGPEHSVYVRGKLTNNNTITLPDHWTGLVHEDTITVNLTPIGKKQDLWVETVSDTTITVGSDNEINCFYTVFAERKDIEKLVTEFDK